MTAASATLGAGAAARAHDVAGLSLPGRERRQHRATIARRLLAQSPDDAAAAALDWDALAAAPDWLAWPDAEAARFQGRVGALLHAPTLRLWIDAPRLAAARSVAGPAYLEALLALPATQALPSDVMDCPRIDTPAQVAPMLRAAGAAVLLASLPAGALRRAAAAAMATARPSNMAAPLAQSLVARTLALMTDTQGVA